MNIGIENFMTKNDCFFFIFFIRVMKLGWKINLMKIC